MNMKKKGSAVLVAAAVLAAAPMASAATYYKIGSDALGMSSFTANVSDSVGWATEPDATQTTPFSEAEMADSDFVVPAGLLLRTPTTAASAWTFGGRSLRIENGAALLVKASDNAVIIVQDLIVAGGGIDNGEGNNTYTIAGKITIETGSTLNLDASENDYTRTIVLAAPVHGDETTAIEIDDANCTGTAIFHFNDLENFSGELRDLATDDYGGAKIYIDGAFGGSVGALSPKMSLVANYDGLPAGKGLVSSSTTISDALKTKLTLYFPTMGFSQPLLPLITFPAGTAVDPAAFTVKHATSADGAATAFAALAVVANEDDTVTLAADMTRPVFAKMARDADDAYAWRFYNVLWGDVTATCGLSAPDAAITVYVTDTAQIAPILANPGTPAGYRIESLAVSADANLAALSPLTFADGFVLDLNGHALTMPGSLINDTTASPKDLVTNGDFEAKSLSNGAYSTSSAPNGWSKSGTVALIRNNKSYAYNQSSTEAGDKQNDTVMCYIALDGYITQTITVSEQVLCTLSLKKANKNYYNKGKKYNSSNGSVQIDDSPKTTLYSESYNQKSISAVFELEAGSHTLKIACTSGVGFSVDDVKIVCTPSTGRITSSATGGELHVDVPPDVVATNAAVNIDGHVKFVKEGAGTFVSERAELFYDGGNEIVEGKLMTAEGTGSNRDWSAVYRTLGELGNTTTVRKEGTLDIAGNYEYGNYPIVLDGGMLRSGRVMDNGAVNQTTNTAWEGIGQLSLTTNSTFYLRSDTRFSGWDSVPINLNGHELLFDMPIDSKRLYMAKDMTNGTIRLTPPDKGKRSFVIYNRAVDARTVDVIDEAGCISPVTAFSVRSYTSTATSGNDWWKGTANMCVYGTFTPATDYFYGCTMMDGSTIDLSEKSGSWYSTSAAACGRQTVDFADNATIYVKLGNRKDFSSATPIISWDSRPANIDGLTFKRLEKDSIMIKLDNGVYIQSGTHVLIR